MLDMKRAAQDDDDDDDEEEKDEAEDIHQTEEGGPRVRIHSWAHKQSWARKRA